MTITTEDIAGLNRRLEEYAASHRTPDLPGGWRYSVSHLGQACAHVSIIDEDNEGEYVADVRIELVEQDPARLLIFAHMMLTKGYERGEKHGRFQARHDVLEALGIDGIVYRADSDQRRADERARADYNPHGAR